MSYYLEIKMNEGQQKTIIDINKLEAAIKWFPKPADFDVVRKAQLQGMYNELAWHKKWLIRSLER